MLRLGERTWLLEQVPDSSPSRTAQVEAVLADYFGAPVRLDREEGRRPLLAPPFQHCALSLAHAYGLILVAVSDQGPVGADLEPLPRLEASWKDAARLLSPVGRQWLAGFDTGRAALAFGYLWTACEAVLKAQGTGLAAELDTVEFGPGLVTGTLPVSPLVVRVDAKAYNVVWQCVRIQDVPILLCRADCCQVP